MERKTFVLDIDGTICHSVAGEYEKAMPMKGRIEVINSLFEQGNTIHFMTARGMGSSGNNVDVAKEKWYFFTENQLRSWGVKYHKLFFGKPAGDVYIDDKAIHDQVFFS
jgi:hypothetical protein